MLPVGCTRRLARAKPPTSPEGGERRTGSEEPGGRSSCWWGKGAAHAPEMIMVGVTLSRSLALTGITILEGRQSWLSMPFVEVALVKQTFWWMFGRDAGRVVPVESYLTTWSWSSALTMVRGSLERTPRAAGQLGGETTHERSRSCANIYTRGKRVEHTVNAIGPMPNR